MLEATDGADALTVAHDREADELVVVPGVFLIRLLGDVRVDPEDRLRERFCRGTVGNILEKTDRVLVVPTQLDEFDRLAVPGRTGRNLQGEHGARNETSSRVIREQFELDCSLEAVSLGQAPHP